ncbi:MAG: hypothetical protein GQ574_21325 [Crocinitomix sp.]|nr:hypothetical protein [Crocinitomix sp.]
MKKLLYLIIGFLAYSCSTENDPLQKEYFYSLNSFETPKVYVYEYVVGVKSEKQYLHLEKVSDSMLKIMVYNGSFDLTSELTDLYTSKGIELIESRHFDDKGNALDSEIIKGQIFSFNTKNIGELEVQGYDALIGIFREEQSDWKIDKFEHSYSEHKMFTSGSMNQTFNPDNGASYSKNFPIEIEYTAGIGTTKMVYYNSVDITSITYIENITLAQFEKLQQTN